MENFTLQNNDSTNLNCFEYQGNHNLLLVFFRGAWCNYCKKQLKDIQSHLQTIRELNIKLLAISCDSKLNSSLIKSFLKLEFPVLSDSDFKVIDTFNLRTDYQGKQVAKPALLLFSANHQPIYSHISPSFDDRLPVTELITKIKTIL